ncbi:MAG: hypothetical protein AAF412_11220 [Pseudomonadota bacterium]
MQKNEFAAIQNTGPNFPLKSVISPDGNWLVTADRIEEKHRIRIFENGPQGLALKESFEVKNWWEPLMKFSSDSRYFLATNDDIGDELFCFNLQTGNKRSWTTPFTCVGTSLFLNQSPSLLVYTECGFPRTGWQAHNWPSPELYRFDLGMIDHQHDMKDLSDCLETEMSWADWRSWESFGLQEEPCIREHLPSIGASKSSKIEDSAIVNGAGALVQNFGLEEMEGELVPEKITFTDDGKFVMIYALDLTTTGDTPYNLVVYPTWQYIWEQGWVYRLKDAEKNF